MKKTGRWPRKKQLARGGPIRKKQRTAAERERIYGPKERVLWIKSLPCVGCGVRGYSDNAHIETGGMGRKADYDKIVPLCGHMSPTISCHEFYHEVGRKAFEIFGNFDLDKIAADIEARWQSHVRSRQGRRSA